MSHVCGEPQLPVSLREPGVCLKGERADSVLFGGAGRERLRAGASTWEGEPADAFLNVRVENRACAKRNVVHRLGSHRS